jgi:hypothetical protein
VHQVLLCFAERRQFFDAIYCQTQRTNFALLFQQAIPLKPCSRNAIAISPDSFNSEAMAGATETVEAPVKFRRHARGKHAPRRITHFKIVHY